MYLPPSFRLDDPEEQLALMRRYLFATIIGNVDGEIEIAHLPLLVDRVNGQFVIHGHLSRGNHLHRAGSVKAVFHGPHAYISARWYQTVDMVPTWNYLTVHAQGAMHLIEDASAQRLLFERLATIMEGNVSGAWWKTLGSEAYEAFRSAIVWFRIDVDGITGKAKLGQDDGEVLSRRIIASLRSAGSPDQIAIAEAMFAQLPH